METDFAALRQYLEGAWLQARGNDDTSRKVRGVIDLLMEDVMRAEQNRPPSASGFQKLRRAS
jgi:hypothetical protein